VKTLIARNILRPFGTRLWSISLEYDLSVSGVGSLEFPECPSTGFGVFH
jgi:hypothetical protein